MATQNIINIGDSARCFTGVASWGGAGGYFDDTTLGSFTVSRPGTGFIKGKPVAWAGAQTVTGMTAGNTYYICIDSAGLIYKTTSEDDAYGGDYIPLFECLRDSTSPTNNQITVREDHPYNMPYLVNHFLHDSIGPIIENHTKGANITLNGTQKIQINGADVLMDHGLSTTIPDSSGVAVAFNKMYTDGTGKWALQETSDTFTGNYNNAGTVTPLGGSKFGVYTLYVSKDNLTTSTPTYYSVLDTSQYNNQAAADTAIANGSTAYATNELAQLELCRLGYIIFSQASNSIVQVIIAKSTFQSSITSAGSSAASLINTTTTNFDGILSSANTNVQSALETIDEWGKTTTDHALLIGNGTGSAIGSLSVGSTGQILTGVTSNDPTWTTATYPATVAIGDVLVASAANVIGVQAGGTTAGYVLTANGAGSAPTFQANAGGGIGTLNGDSGSATGPTVTVAGGTNLTTVGSSSTLTINLDNDITLATGGALRTSTSGTNTVLLQAYDVDGTAYKTFATLTAGNTPTFDLDTDTTIATAYIYRGAGTDVAVTDGGTGVSTLTDHGILLGSGTGAVTVTGAPTDGQLLIGKSSDDPQLATLTASTGVTVANGAGTITLSSTTTTGNTQTDSYALVIGDAGKFIIMNKSTANTLTVPKNSSVAFATGTIVGVVQYGAGATTIAPVDGDVTLRSKGSALQLYAQYSTATLVKIGTDEWIVSGDLV